jgi:UDP-N-acetylglucosamine/UDP-N-acetylgalactosamine diphosphorylase
MITKLCSEDKVDVFCGNGGKIYTMEYADLPNECAMARTSTRELQFPASNTAIHIFDIQFIKCFNGDGIQSEIPYQMAKKIISIMDNLGEPFVPDVSNGITLEILIFDAFLFADRNDIFESARSEIFSSLKNSGSMDSRRPTSKTSCGYLLAG